MFFHLISCPYLCFLLSKTRDQANPSKGVESFFFIPSFTQRWHIIFYFSPRHLGTVVVCIRNSKSRSHSHAKLPDRSYQHQQIIVLSSIEPNNIWRNRRDPEGEGPTDRAYHSHVSGLHLMFSTLANAFELLLLLVQMSFGFLFSSVF